MTNLNATTLNATAVKLPAAAGADRSVPAAAPFAIRTERAADIGAREALLDAAFGAGRFERTCQRLRDGRLPAEGLAFVATRRGPLSRSAASVVGTLRLWHVNAGGKPALMLGPLAVDPACRSLGIGAALMVHAIAAAERRGHGAVVLLGDAPYYARFGFSASSTGALTLPGPYESDRLLALELREGALAGAVGMILPTGAAEGRSRPREGRAVAKAA
jgi:predicted N-acetyltransferase YhbS